MNDKQNNLKEINKINSAVFYFAVIGLMFFGQLIALIPLYTVPPGVWRGFALSGISAVILVVPLLIYTQKKLPYSIKEIFRFKKFSAGDLLFGIIGTAGIVAFGSAITSLIYQILPDTGKELFEEMYTFMSEMYKSLFSGETPGLFAVALIAGAVFPGVYEELAFRGFLQKTSEKTMKYVWAILLPAFVFAFIHFNVVGFAQILFLALLFGYIAFKTDTIWIGVICHILNNVFSISVMNFTDYSSTAEELTLPALHTAAYIVLGALSIFISFRHYSKIPSPKLSEREFENSGTGTNDTGHSGNSANQFSQYRE